MMMNTYGEIFEIMVSDAYLMLCMAGLSFILAMVVIVLVVFRVRKGNRS